MSDTHKERLRKIARDAVPSRVFSGNVLALEAVYAAGVVDGIRQARAVLLRTHPNVSEFVLSAIDALDAIDNL
jgi:hypothetical protein